MSALARAVSLALILATPMVAHATAAQEPPVPGATSEPAGAPAPGPAQDLPRPPDDVQAEPPPASRVRSTLLLAGGWEEAVLQDVRFSGPVGTIGLRWTQRAPAHGTRVRFELHAAGRRGETPEGLSGYALRLGFLVGAEHGRIGFGLGVDWARTSVERVTAGRMLGLDLALTAAATVDLWRGEPGSLSAELVGAASGDTRQRSLALVLAYRFHLN